MKRGHKAGEGRLIAVALLALCALAFGSWRARLPLEVSAQPLHSVNVEALEDVVLIDINTADVDRLDELPGIGPVLAQAIVTYREEHGPFTSVDELDDVPGIGPVKLEAMRPLVRLE